MFDRYKKNEINSSQFTKIIELFVDIIHDKYKKCNSFYDDFMRCILDAAFDEITNDSDEMVECLCKQIKKLESKYITGKSQHNAMATIHDKMISVQNWETNKNVRVAFSHYMGLIISTLEWDVENVRFSYASKTIDKYKSITSIQSNCPSTSSIGAIEKMFAPRVCDFTYVVDKICKYEVKWQSIPTIFKMLRLHIQQLHVHLEVNPDTCIVYKKTLEFRQERESYCWTQFLILLGFVQDESETATKLIYQNPSDLRLRHAVLAINNYFSKYGKRYKIILNYKKTNGENTNNTTNNEIFQQQNVSSHCSILRFLQL
eukprot:408530_1